MSYELRSARFLAASVLEQVLAHGDTAVDATMGNGHDTLRMCTLVGDTGRVHAFDVQRQAVENTEALLRTEGVLERASLHLCGHEHMKEYVPQGVSAVMFNLGWLPGGDKSVTTQWETTRTAVQAALELLRPMGVLILCAYPGHAEGDRERRNVTEWFAALPPQRFNVLHQVFINAGPGAPECFIVQKQPAADRA